MKKTVCILIAVILFCGMLAGCGANNKFLGKWNCYKVVTNSTEIVFKDYESIAKMEMTCELTDDNKYVIHYTTNGKEGEKYPQSGTYRIEGDEIILEDHDGTGKIEGNELILSFSNGQVKQYFTK